jgi:hypothetical protein
LNLFWVFCLLQTFAIRFASSEIAQEYKAEFTKYQAEMQSLLFGADSTEGSAEADSAAAALDSLTVKATEETAAAPAAEETPATETPAAESA